MVSVDISADSRPIYQSTIGRLSAGSVFVSRQPTSGKNLSSGSVCTDGKLSSVDVHVTSTVFTELGIHEPTSVFKLCWGCRYVTSVWCCYMTVLGL